MEVIAMHGILSEYANTVNVNTNFVVSIQSGASNDNNSSSIALM